MAVLLDSTLTKRDRGVSKTVDPQIRVEAVYEEVATLQVTPKPARRLAPLEFVPWVKQLLRAGHTVHVVYEACGFGFGLYRELQAAGAHCYVIASRKLDEQSTRVKTDLRDATTLCQRLSRYLDGNTRAGGDSCAD